MLSLARYSEIALKGKNRQIFERQLVNNIKAFLKAKGLEGEVKRIQGRILLQTDFEVDLRPIFGIASFSSCVQVQAKLEDISSAALKMAETHPKTTRFRITTHRSTKNVPLTSPQLNERVGSLIVQSTGMKVGLESPDLEIGIELIDDLAYVFNKNIPCFGGLPVGIEGKVLALLSDEKSVLAALVMAKRGCAIEIASQADFSESDYSLLQLFSPSHLKFHRISQIDELDELALKLGCKAIVVPDTLADLKQYPVILPILRPLITFSEQELLAEQKRYSLSRYQ
jgi:adenylyl- and sulfurtransferase ThiI